MLALKKSEQIRELVSRKYVEPALRSGSKELDIRAGDVLRDWEAQGLPRARTTMICNVLKGNKLLQTHGLTIVDVEGPASQESRNTVVHYRAERTLKAQEGAEEAAAWANRVTDKAFGLLKDEIGAYGGAEAFMRFLRDEDEVRP